MRHVRQKRDNDCGVACVAMLCDVSYAKALAAFAPAVQERMRTKKAGTTTTEVTHAIRNLGWECESRLRVLRKQNMGKILGRALVCVRNPNRKVGNWHWVAYYGTTRYNYVLDPAAEIQTYFVSSCLRVWRPR